MAVVFVGATELIGHGLPRLLAVRVDSGAMDALAADPGLVERAVDEGFRVVTPWNVILRAVARDTEIEEHAIRSVPCQRSAPERPDEFELHRTIPVPPRRLAFGAGVHDCLGIGLALAEARQVVGSLADLGGQLVIGRRRCHRGSLYPGYASLPLRLRSRKAGLCPDPPKARLWKPLS